MNPTAGSLAIQAAKLCKYCQVLSFNDSDPRFKGITEDGTQPYLCVGLEYQVHDSLPDLPILQESAKGGCDFCRLLRGTILSEDSAADNTLRQFLVEKQQCDVEISLEYCWMPPQDCHSKSSPAPRIMILTAILDIEYHDIDEGGDRSYMAFSFLIEGCEGSCAPLVYIFLRLMLAFPNRSRYGRAMSAASWLYIVRRSTSSQRYFMGKITNRDVCF